MRRGQRQRPIVGLPLNAVTDGTQLISLSGGSLNKSCGTNTGSKVFYSSHAVSAAGGGGNTTNYLLDGAITTTVSAMLAAAALPRCAGAFSVETGALRARYGLHVACRERGDQDHPR